MKFPNRSDINSGFSLIEALVTLSIMSIGGLALMNLNVQSMKAIRSNGLRMDIADIRIMMPFMRYRIKYLILVLTSLVLQSSCKAKKIDARLNEVMEAASGSEIFSPWDFTFQLQSGENADNPNLLSASLFIQPEVFSKAVSHLLLESNASESKSDAEIISRSVGTKNKFRRDGLDTCMKNIQNWKVQTIRIAPYESLMPGDIKGLNRIVQKKAPHLRGDLIPVIRLVVNPFCGGEFQDAALHLVYSTAIPNDIRVSLLNAVSDFRSAASSGQDKAAEDILSQYATTLAGPEFQAYRRKFIENLLPIVAHRRNLGDAKYNFLNQVVLPKIGSSSRIATNTGGIFLEDAGSPNERTLTSPGFESLEGSGYKVLKQFLNLELKKENLINIALFSIADARAQWFFALTNPTGKPIPIQSNALIETPNGVKLSPILRTGMLADISMPSSTESNLGSIKDQGLLSKFDLFATGERGTLEWFNSQNAAVNQKLPLLLDPEETNAATTSCASCHLLSHSHISQGQIGVDDPEPESNFHLTSVMGRGSMISSRMIAEVLHESKLLNIEAKLKGIDLAQIERLPVFPVAAATTPIVGATPCVVQSNEGDGFMKVRPEPSTVQKEIGIAKNGHQLMKIGVSGAWAKVQIRIPPGSEPLRVGYISSNGLKCNPN